MNKEKAKEILIKYKDKSDLFNWCEEYKDYINKNIHCLVNQEAEYMLNKSWEDSESPLSYEDCDLNDYEGLKENIIYEIENNYKEEEEQIDLREEINLVQCGDRRYLDISEEQSFKDFVNNLYNEDLGSLNDEIFQIELPQHEIYQWFIVSWDIAQHIKEHNGIILNENWFGRECCGQAVDMDYMFMKIYIGILENRFNEEELKQINKE